MKLLSSAAVLGLLIGGAWLYAQDEKPTAPGETAEETKEAPKPLSDEEVKKQASYAIGVTIGTNLSELKELLDLEQVKRGLTDKFKGNETPTEEEMEAALQQFQVALVKFQREKREKAVKENLEEAEAFLAENKKKEGVKTTKSGLQYIVVEAGEGKKPKATDVVKVHYHGTLLDGTVFDSSKDRGQPVEFPLNRVIPGWTEGVQLMPVGSKFKFFIHPELAYGENPRPDSEIQPNQALVFEVELLDIITPQPPANPLAPRPE